MENPFYLFIYFLKLVERERVWEVAKEFNLVQFSLASGFVEFKMPPK